MTILLITLVAFFIIIELSSMLTYNFRIANSNNQKYYQHLKNCTAGSKGIINDYLKWSVTRRVTKHPYSLLFSYTIHEKLVFKWSKLSKAIKKRFEELNHQ